MKNLCCFILLLSFCSVLNAQIDLDNPYFRDQVFLDDLIVDGSACIGMDCVNGENFGFSTIRIKENNVRIEFFDTSASASFPGNDWMLEANSSDNGGTNHFAILDITGSKIPFKTIAGAPTNALYIDAEGDIGLGSSNPVVELHIKDGDSPTIRLEQDGSAGFGSQTFDIAANETNFFIRDVTNSSRLPFKIRPGAPDNMIVIDGTTDRIGFGTDGPQAFVHVQKPAESGVKDEIALFRLNNSASTLKINNASSANSTFSPQIEGSSAESGPAMTFLGIVDDTIGSTQPGILMNVRTNEESELANRPLLDIQNNDESFMFISPDGNVGIQTTSPTQLLDVSGGFRSRRIADKDNEYGSEGQVLSPSGNQLDWIDIPSSGIYDSDGTIANNRTVGIDSSLNIDMNTLYLDGLNNRVGVGTNMPSHSLHVVGDIGLTGLVVGASDLRLKEDIKTIQNARELILALDGKQYRFKQYQYPSLKLPAGNQYGLIAQDVEAVMSDVVYPNFISHQLDNGKSTNLKGINYNAIIPVLINAVKEQDEIILSQAQQIEELIKRQTTILNRLSELEK